MTEYLDIDRLAYEIYEAVREDDKREYNKREHNEYNDMSDDEYNEYNDMSDDEYKDSDMREIKEILEPIFKLIEDAKQKRMYLYIKPCQKWFSPFELERKLKTGYYVFTADNWELRNPTERLNEIQKEINDRLEEVGDIEIYMSGINGYLKGDN